MQPSKSANQTELARTRRDPPEDYEMLPHWSPRATERLAREEGIELEEAHWQVVFFLRERYRDEGDDMTARSITRELATEFSDDGGLRRLYALFPRGPVAQGCKLAGLPLPSGTFNRSFGSSH